MFHDVSEGNWDHSNFIHTSRITDGSFIALDDLAPDDAEKQTLATMILDERKPIITMPLSRQPSIWIMDGAYQSKAEIHEEIQKKATALAAELPSGFPIWRYWGVV